MSALAGGDASAAGPFARRFGPLAYGIALRVTGDRHTAEDVAQAALERAWHRAGTYDPGRGSVAAWFGRITRNMAIDARRRTRDHLTDPVELAAVSLAARGSGPDELAALGSERDRVRVALAALPDEQRRAVLLAAWYGHTAREVAALEAVPLGTAKTRIRTGLHRLRAALAEADPDAPAAAPGGVA